MLFNCNNPIRTQRHKEKLTQIALAKAVGVSQGHIYKIEAGYSVPTPLLLHKMALVLRCEPRDLVTKNTESTVNA